MMILISLDKKKVLWILLLTLFLVGKELILFPLKIFAQGYFTEKKYYKTQEWNSDNKEYEFHSPLSDEDLKNVNSYFILFVGRDNKYLFSERYINNILQATFYFNTKKQITHFYYYLDGQKKGAIFYNEKGIKTKEYQYDITIGKKKKEVYYRKETFYKDDGKTIYKTDYYDHLKLRKTILYYKNGKKKSVTEYFEGKKKYYNRQGKVTKVKRFIPKRLFEFK